VYSSHTLFSLWMFHASVCGSFIAILNIYQGPHAFVSLLVGATVLSELSSGHDASLTIALLTLLAGIISMIAGILGVCRLI
jgi:MFS superfamily sulfate permease-like transporter